jgi:hypothetical protein
VARVDAIRAACSVNCTVMNAKHHPSPCRNETTEARAPHSVCCFEFKLASDQLCGYR